MTVEITKNGGGTGFCFASEAHALQEMADERLRPSVHKRDCRFTSPGSACACGAQRFGGFPDTLLVFQRPIAIAWNLREVDDEYAKAHGVQHVELRAPPPPPEPAPDAIPHEDVPLAVPVADPVVHDEHTIPAPGDQR